MIGKMRGIHTWRQGVQQILSQSIKQTKKNLYISFLDLCFFKKIIFIFKILPFFPPSLSKNLVMYTYPCLFLHFSNGCRTYILALQVVEFD